MICTTLMDDMATSSTTSIAYVKHMNTILYQATNDGFEIKLVKGAFQPTVDCVVGLYLWQSRTTTTSEANQTA